MCANEIGIRIVDVSKDQVLPIEDKATEVKSKDEKKTEKKFPLIDPMYIHLFWPVY